MLLQSFSDTAACSPPNVVQNSASESRPEGRMDVAEAEEDRVGQEMPELACSAAKLDHETERPPVQKR